MARNEELQMKLKDLQNKQMQYDADYFMIKTQFEKIRHITLHLTSTLGKMAKYCEIKEHENIPSDTIANQLEHEVIPDLLIHSLQLANIFNLDLNGEYFERLENNIKRLASNVEEA